MATLPYQSPPRQAGGGRGLSMPVRWPQSRRGWIILAAFAVPAIAVIVVVAQGLWWYAGLRERLRLADEHAPIVRKALNADGRFSDITVESFTGSNGCLRVWAIAPPGTTRSLKAIVESTAPPVPVWYTITELAAATRPAR